MDYPDSYDNENKEEKRKVQSGGCCSIILLIVLLVWGYNSWKENKYSKPWWTGTETMKVCEVFGNENCYKLPVRSDGEVIDQIYLPNGGSISAYDSDCGEAASFYNFDQVCTMWDSDGNKYDISPD